MERSPSVAGQFYPGTETALKKELSRILTTVNVKKREKVIGVVAPHAGYMYSGAVAGCVFSSIEIPQTIIILGPNHTGIGAEFSLYEEGTWHTPLGDVEIDGELADRIFQECKFLTKDTKAHSSEHSLEVQLPFLQYLKKDIKIVPIVLSSYSAAAYKRLGEAIASSIVELKKDALIVASTDMTHYESQETAKEKDQIAIDDILKLDEDGLIKHVEELGISMCGYIPTAVMLIAAKILGAKGAQLIKYQTSGDITGDYSAVVGYAGISVK